MFIPSLLIPTLRKRASARNWGSARPRNSRCETFWGEARNLAERLARDLESFRPRNGKS